MGEYYLIRPRLGEDDPNRVVTVSADVDRLSSKSSGTPPSNPSGQEAEAGWPRGSIPLRRVPVHGARRRSWKGALKAPTYLLAPVRLSSARGKDSHREASPCIILTYSNLQQPKVDFSSQPSVLPELES